jgi:prolyl-tRNA editing enzyme YbaK/EbsC (Cys-tRNA(Pro) deacylase)
MPPHPRTAASLDAASTPHEVVDCDPDLADTAAFCEAYGFSPADSANAIVVVGKSDPPRHVCCVVLATHRLDVNGTVRRRLGVRKASFAAHESGEALTGMTSGGITPVGLDTMPVWIDAAVMQRERIVVGGGTRDCKVVASPDLLVELGGEVVDGLARPIDG